MKPLPRTTYQLTDGRTITKCYFVGDKIRFTDGKISHKLCSVCHEWVDISDFHIYTLTDGVVFRSDCVLCYNDRQQRCKIKRDGPTKRPPIEFRLTRGPNGELALKCYRCQETRSLPEFGKAKDGIPTRGICLQCRRDIRAAKPKKASNGRTAASEKERTKAFRNRNDSMFAEFIRGVAAVSP